MYVKFLLPVQIVSAGSNKRKSMKIKLNNLQHFTFYSIIRPLKYYVFGNIMENRALLLWSKCSIFHNIFKSISPAEFGRILGGPGTLF